MRVACLIVALVGAVPAARAQEPIVTTDLLRVRTVTSIDVAADGSKTVSGSRTSITTSDYCTRTPAGGRARWRPCQNHSKSPKRWD